MILLIAKCCMFNWCFFRNGYLAAGIAQTTIKCLIYFAGNLNWTSVDILSTFLFFPEIKLIDDMKLLETPF